MIHFLLSNADGDLYQIAEKFNQRQAVPFVDDVIDDDDDLNKVIIPQQQATYRTMADEDEDIDPNIDTDASHIDINKMAEKCSLFFIYLFVSMYTNFSS